MGFFKSFLLLSIFIALNSFLIQKYSPSTVERIISDPYVKQFNKVATKYFEEISTQVIKVCGPTFDNIKEVVVPLLPWTGDAHKHSKGASGDSKKNPSECMFTHEDLKQYDGSSNSKGLYLAFMGQVFDVKKGEKFYGPDKGYGFFAGRDATRAFVSGQFDEDGLTDDIRGLSHTDYLGLSDWTKFYHKDYTYVGKVVGRYYTADGQETEYKKQADRWIKEAKEEKDRKENEEKLFPPCNSEWAPDIGARVWCSTTSGGVERTWAGVPRQLFTPGKSKPRCACIKASGSSSTGTSTGNRGDLDSPNLKEYPGCDPKSDTCAVLKEEVPYNPPPKRA